MLHAEVTLPGEPSSVPTARRFVESILDAWGQPERGWTAALVVSELTANSTLHARTAFTVAVELHGDTVRLEVRDGSTRSPAVRSYGPDATTGRGMHLVDELSSSWGVDPRGDGKTVWVLLEPAAGDEDVHEEDVDLDAVLLRLGAQPDGGHPAGPQLRAA